VNSPLRVLSFDHTALVGGVTTWNLRMLQAFVDHPDLGIEFNVAGNADPARISELASRLPVISRPRLLSIKAGRGKPVNAIRRWANAHPDLSACDVVLPNNAIEGWLFTQAIAHSGQRPCVVGAIHSDEEGYYQMCGMEGPVDAVLAVSQHCLNVFRHRFPPISPTAFVPYGVPTSTAPKSFTVDGPLKIAYCGRLDRHQKRVFDFVTLMKLLVKSQADIEFNVVGEGSDGPELVRQLRSVMGERFVYHGRLSSELVPPFYAKQDVFVQTSEYEGTSISMLEAMGQGLPAVVTEVASGVGDVIRHGVNGWLVPIGDMNAMSAILTDLAAHRHRLYEPSNKAWETIRHDYSLRHSANCLAALIRRAVDRPRGAYRITANHPQLNRLDLSPLPDFVVRGIRWSRSKFSRFSH
jgi:glycosyltransferase involved in cell wall biosynthesis